MMSAYSRLKEIARELIVLLKYIAIMVVAAYCCLITYRYIYFGFPKTETMNGLVHRSAPIDDYYVKKITGWEAGRFIADVSPNQPIMGVFSKSILVKASECDIRAIVKRYKLNNIGPYDIVSNTEPNGCSVGAEITKYIKNVNPQKWVCYTRYNSIGWNEMQKIVGPIDARSKNKEREYNIMFLYNQDSKIGIIIIEV